MTLRPNPLLALLLLSLSPVGAATSILRGPYLQSAAPDSIVIRWRTDATEASVVSYGTDREQLTSVAKTEGILTEHIVPLSGLKPATTYYYTVGAAPYAPPAAGKSAPGRVVRLAHETLLRQDSDYQIRLTGGDETRLVVTDTQGRIVFNDTIDTPERRSRMPVSIRGRVEEMERSLERKPVEVGRLDAAPIEIR